MSTTFNKIISSLAIVFILFISTAISQPWTETLPQDREAKVKLTLNDYQEAFDSFWAPFKVDKGYYIEEGEKQKAGGWKQFKRWEWFWESRVNPQTGEFPKTSAMEQFKKYQIENVGGRSPSGNWTSLGTSSSGGGYAGIGRLNCVAFNPDNDNLIYAGSAAGGVWKTTDGGTNWTAIGDENDALGTADIVVVTTAGDDILYLATGDRDHSDTYSVGVLKSIDGGSTWNTTGLSWTQSQGYMIYRLLIDPNDNSVLYAATNDGVFKTTNAGDSWSQITTTNFKDLELNPSNSATLYGSTGWGEIYLSTNSGANWSQVLSDGSGRRTQLAVTADNSAIVYAIMASSGNGLHAIYKSTNSGSSFSMVFSGSTTNLLDWACNGSGSGGQGWYDLCIASDPTDSDIVFTGGVNTWKSTDGGSSWSIVNHWSSSCGGQATNVHADKHYLAFQNGSSTLFECNDGGIYKTTDSGDSWNDLTNTMVISQMYRLGVAQTVSNDVITGLQDNGTKNYEAGTWEDVIGGDGMECAIDFTDEDTQYGSLYYGDIKRTTNHWLSSTTISDGIPGGGAWVTPYLIDPNNSSTLYVGYSDVWKSTNQGNSWTQISNWGGSNLQALAVASSNSQFIYAATYSTIYRTTNGGSSWTDITSNLPVSSDNITYISVKDDNPNTVWVSFSGFNAEGVYQTTNGGSSWTNISAGLPQLPVNCVIQNTLNTGEEELYAGTDVGVYVKIGSDDWTSFIDGLPNVVVNELDIYYDETTPANSLIRAATFGRGLWESDLWTAFPVPVTDFEADNLTPTTVDTVHFTDLTTNDPTSWLWEITPATFDFIDGTDENSQNPVCIFNEGGLYTVALTATNNGGSNTETKDDYINVSQAVPVADFEADNLTPTTIDTVYFTDLSENNPTSWLWEFDPITVTFIEGTDETTQNPAVQFDAVGLYTVTLTATNDGGSNTETKDNYIDVTEVLSVIVSADPVEICVGESSQLEAVAGGGTGIYTYLWYSDPADPTLAGQENLINPLVSPLITTTYFCEVEDGEDVVTEEVLVIVNPLPEITLGDWPETLCNQLEPPIQLTAEPEGGVYSGSNVTENGIFTPETAPLGWNIITYTFEDEFACENSAQDSIFVDECVGVISISTDELISIYPNPNIGNFTISAKQSIAKVEIIDQMGKIVLSSEVNRKFFKVNTKLDKGIYFARVKLVDGSQTDKKIVIR